jgi:aminopeptidase N
MGKIKGLMKLYLFTAILLYFFSVQAIKAQTGIGDTIHVVHYNIHMEEINTDDQTIRGYTELQLTPLVENLEYIPLELKDLTVDSVKIKGQLTEFTHVDEVIRVPLNDQAKQTDTIQVIVYYGGEPFHETWGGFHWDEEYAFNLGVGFVSIPLNLGKTWFPCVDNFTDRATYDFFVTVENSKKAICGGILQDTIDNGNGSQTWHWRIDKPIPTYLASVATGDYVLYFDEYFGMEDTIPITIYTRPSEQEKVAGSFVNLKAVLEWFEARFGPYPFGRVGYTGTDIGAMEHATNIAYPHGSINGNTSSEGLLVHELSHMWLGDMVTCSSAEDMWLNEGWATFCAELYVKDFYGHDIYLDNLRFEQREVMRTAHIADDGYHALNNIPQLVTYGAHAYDKGGLVTNTLRNYLGDSLFFATMTNYLENFAFQSVASEDMRDFITANSGVDVTDFFDAWVFTPGTPHFSFDSVNIIHNGDYFTVECFVKQKYKGAEFLADGNILEVSFVDDFFNVFTDTISFSGKTGFSVKNVPFEPQGVFLDFHEKTCDASTHHVEYFTAPAEFNFQEAYFKLLIEQISDSALVRVGHHWVGPDSLKTPIPGLTLSPSRYWKIEGIIPDNFSAKGQFTYDIGNYIDHELIKSANDSVVLLYRKNSGMEWIDLPQSQYGTWDFGVIEVENLTFGEYTLAVWDKQIVATTEIKEPAGVLIYPNPSDGILNFEFPGRGKYEILIHDSLGSQIDQFTSNGKSKRWKWRKGNDTTGIVFITIIKNRKKISTDKIIITR